MYFNMISAMEAIKTIGKGIVFMFMGLGGVTEHYHIYLSFINQKNTCGHSTSN